MRTCVATCGNNGGEGCMMISQTLDKLSEMHLGAMAAEYRRQAELPAMSELGFEERFSMVVDAQWLYRNNAKLKRLLKQADLSEPHACLADIDYDPVRKLDRAQIARLSYLDFVRQGQDILITGATGTGNYVKLYIMGKVLLLAP